jgi:hypothetical protein
VSLSAVFWVKDNDAEYENITIYTYIFNEEAINKFQYTLLVKYYIKLCNFGSITFTGNI